ncbi:MAG: hypothetical protein K9M45_10380 [Kiritimatiellales bacterium]|nr:hypothetical protein [Kiritimatiellales bacterium]
MKKITLLTALAFALTVCNSMALYGTMVKSKSSPAPSVKEQGILIFEDDFERNESQETKDEVGNGWGTNSKSRAKGNKQVDLRDGAMYIYIHAEANHGVSVTHPAEFCDGVVELRFMLEGAKDGLGLDFADQGCKEVHAGHLIAARVSTKGVTLEDLKTGKMANKIHDMSPEEKKAPDVKKMLAEKGKLFPAEFKTGQWYKLRVEIIGDTLRAEIDGKEVGAFSSEGIAHPTKRVLRLAVPRNVVVDDIKIYRLAPLEK